MESLSKQNENKSAIRGTQLVPIGIPTISLLSTKSEVNNINLFSKFTCQRPLPVHDFLRCKRAFFPYNA